MMEHLWRCEKCDYEEWVPFEIGTLSHIATVRQPRTKGSLALAIEEEHVLRNAYPRVSRPIKRVIVRYTPLMVKVDETDPLHDVPLFMPPMGDD